MKIQKEETEIIGNWIFDGKRSIADDQSERIEWLISRYLIKTAQDESGWLILYQDPEDQRYWQLNWRVGEMQGFGPKSLILMSDSEAKSKYKI